MAVCQMSGQSIVVQIAEVGAHACKGGPFVVVSHAGLKTHFFKSLSLQVVEEAIGAVVIGHKYVEKAVAIVIGKHDSHPLAQDG